MAITQEDAERIAASYTAAWNSGDPAAVASFFAPGGTITINAGEPYVGRDGVTEMAAGFLGSIPNLTLTCDGARAAGDHAVYLWTFTGTHSDSGAAMRVSGWEDWTVGEDGLISQSRGWFDADRYAQQIDRGSTG